MAEYYLAHHGIKGQRWGERNGPPYPLGGGDYTQTEWKALKKERRNKYSIYNKKHYDEIIKEGTTLQTLARDPNRTKDTDMFYASHTKADNRRYNAMYNHKNIADIYDAEGNVTGTGKIYKYQIHNKATKDIKVASQDTGSKYIRDLYEKDRDFYNFVTDPDRLEKYTKSMYIPHGSKYINNMHKLQDKNYTPTDKDLHTLYDTFNCVIPNTDKDVVNQREKFFKALKNDGYSAVIDVNDAINHPLRSQSPVIVFDQSAYTLQSVRQTNVIDVTKAKAYTTGRMILGGMFR